MNVAPHAPYDRSEERNPFCCCVEIAGEVGITCTHMTPVALMQNKLGFGAILAGAVQFIELRSITITVMAYLYYKKTITEGKQYLFGSRAEMMTYLILCNKSRSMHYFLLPR